MRVVRSCGTIADEALIMRSHVISLVILHTTWIMELSSPGSIHTTLICPLQYFQVERSHLVTLYVKVTFSIECTALLIYTVYSYKPDSLSCIHFIPTSML